MRALALLPVITLLSACLGDDYGPATVTALSAGGYEVTADGKTITLPATDSVVTGSDLTSQGYWTASLPGTSGQTYESANVLAVGGVHNGAGFGAISGTPVAPPSITTVYQGLVGYSYAGSYVSIPINLTFDPNGVDYQLDGLALNAVTGVVVRGTVSGTTIYGSVTLSEGGNYLAAAPIDGGFYGTDEVAGAFSGDDFGGVFYGVAN